MLVRVSTCVRFSNLKPNGSIDASLLRFSKAKLSKTQSTIQTEIANPKLCLKSGFEVIAERTHVTPITLSIERATSSSKRYSYSLQDFKKAQSYVQSRAFTTSSSSSSSSSKETIPPHRPLWKRPLGVSLIGFFLLGVLYQIQKKFMRNINQETPTEMIAHNWQAEILLRLPLRGMSSIWGYFAHTTIPVWLRTPIYSTYAYVFGCNLDEMKEDSLKNFRSMADFFARRLKDGVRKMDDGLVSPVDGKVLYFGEVQGDTLEQVKGVTYTLTALLGTDPLLEQRRQSDQVNKTKLYHIVLYLAPGDYHGIHAPTDLTVTKRRHFPGHLLPVAPLVANMVRGLFALNERVVLQGKWNKGLFYIVPVGATNVGTISVTFDEELKTNQQPKPKEAFYDRSFTGDGVKLVKGDEAAFFHMGSTVVLVFECPNFEFSVTPGQKILLGQRLGNM